MRQDFTPTKHMPSMADQTDVGMAKEERGPMMSTGFQVPRIFCLSFI